MARPESRSRTATGAWFLLVAACLAPHAGRLAWPSLYADDVVRVEQLQTLPFGRLLFLPFNEHLAPLFQVVSWVTWHLAGRTLANAPLAFTVASFLPFLLVLALLAWVVWRECGSTTATAAALPVFSLSWLAVETVYWYSASSFMWALAAALAAWLGARRSAREGVWPGALIAGLASAAAPAFSAIGLLAGPLAGLRVLTEPAVPLKRRLAALTGPALGVVAYLAFALVFRYQAVLADSLEHQVDIPRGLMATARAPVEVLLPALAGMQVRVGSVAGFVVETLIAAGLAAVLCVVAWRRTEDRALILGGLALVFGGYALVFCGRAGGFGPILFQTQRYHLFPMLGLVLVLAGTLRRPLAVLDARPAWDFATVSLAVVVLSATHIQELRGRSRFLRYPDQTRTLAALDRLGEVCVRQGVTREQALAALDPVETEWTPAGFGFLRMLPACATSEQHPQGEVRALILSSLSRDDLGSICGGMDATPYLASTSDDRTGETVTQGHVARLFRVRPAADGRLEAEGWPAFVEFEMKGASPAGARELELPRDVPAGWAEVWWRGASGRWTETRSIRLKLSRPPAGTAWRVPLARLPHWDPAQAARVRLLLHEPGPIAAAPTPRLIR
ncbi:MAG: hypothetical protein U0835_08255 [Isosphaeraceae bacterium]